MADETRACKAEGLPTDTSGYVEKAGNPKVPLETVVEQLQTEMRLRDSRIEARLEHLFAEIRLRDSRRDSELENLHMKLKQLEVSHDRSRRFSPKTFQEEAGEWTDEQLLESDRTLYSKAVELVSGANVNGVPDSSITASTSYDHNHVPKFGRLHTQAKSGQAGAWCAKVLDANQWIQVELASPMTILAVQTQGRAECDQKVTSYKVQYSNDGIAWNSVRDYTGQEQVFPGNSDRNTVVTNAVHLNTRKPIQAKFIRICPQTWIEHISMRFGLLGCA